MPESLICKICGGLLEEPHRVKCGYSFCLQCIENIEQEKSQKKVAKKSSQKKSSKSCGICGTTEQNCFDKNYCVKNFILCEVIDSIKVVCPLCEKDLKFCELDSHLKGCKGLVNQQPPSSVL